MSNGIDNSTRYTESQRLLAEKFPQIPKDDPIFELASWNALLEHKVDDLGRRLDTWTTAILKVTELSSQQNQLIVSQNLELQATSRNNVALGQTLNQFKQGLNQLKQEFSVLKDTIALQDTTLQALKNEEFREKLDALSKKMESLETLETLEALNKKVDKLTASLGTLHRRSSFNSFPLVWGGALIVSIQIVQLFACKLLSENVQIALQGVRERAEWALIKLERIETNLGIRD